MTITLFLLYCFRLFLPSYHNNMYNIMMINGYHEMKKGNWPKTLSKLRNRNSSSIREVEWSFIPSILSWIWNSIEGLPLERHGEPYWLLLYSSQSATASSALLLLNRNSEVKEAGVLHYLCLCYSLFHFRNSELGGMDGLMSSSIEFIQWMNRLMSSFNERIDERTHEFIHWRNKFMRSIHEQTHGLIS